MRRLEWHYQWPYYPGRYAPRRKRPNPVLILWRWRWELGFGIGTLLGLETLVDATHPAASLYLLATALATWVSSPDARRFLTARAQAVLVQHRLRVGMVESGVLSWSGWLPALIWTRVVDRGVHVLIWCPGGVDVTAFHATRSLLAAACWASDVEVARHPRYAHLVVLLVITRSGP